jgi:protease-4
MGSRIEPLRSLGANALGLGRALARRLFLPRGHGYWLRVKVAGPLPDLTQPMALPGRSPAGLGLLPLLECLEVAARDPRVLGVLVKVDAAPGGLSQVLTLRRALAAVREAGKPVVAWGERWGAEELLLASAASRVLMPEAGSVYLVGLRLETYFLKDLLDRLGLEPDVLRVGDFKNAAEILTRRGMSSSQREQLEALLDDSYEALVTGIGDGRGIAPARVRELVDQGPYTAEAARRAGLIDGCMFPDEVDGVLEELAPSGIEDPPRPALVDVAVYHAFCARERGWRSLRIATPRLAYVVATGPIRHGSSSFGIGSDSYRGLLRDLAEDSRIRAVVLRIESPGGDSLASDLLWRSVRQLAAEKPVVVSMGEVAASGGYYMAVAADAILAEPTAVTGSIGVVGGKLSLADLYRRLGVGHEGVERGARAGLLSASRPFSRDERAALKAEMRELYERFLGRVAEGRGMTLDAVRPLAGGRIWSGAEALRVGLVDAPGGPLEALAEARRRAGLRPGEAALVESHPRRARVASLLRMLRGQWWGP